MTIAEMNRRMNFEMTLTFECPETVLRNGFGVFLHFMSHIKRIERMCLSDI
jgi:hypothetical protein